MLVPYLNRRFKNCKLVSEDLEFRGIRIVHDLMVSSTFAPAKVEMA
jgi:hypothetical protein